MDPFIVETLHIISIVDKIGIPTRPKGVDREYNFSVSHLRYYDPVFATIQDMTLHPWFLFQSHLNLHQHYLHYQNKDGCLPVLFYHSLNHYKSRVLYPPPLIPPGSGWILGRMVGMVGIWSECHFSESPPKFYSDSNPIPTKFPPFQPESLRSMWIKFLPGS